MRLLLSVMVILILLAFWGFFFTNTGERVNVNLWGTLYSDVPLYRVVGISFALGAAFVTIIALAEGSVIRLSNRRLRKKINRLETETSFLRSQPTPTGEAESPAEPPAESSRQDVESIPTAPVYETRETSRKPEDEDTYSGGTAV